jgi:small neutral amino acid transporter SnatA (MarC family)
MGRAPSPRVGLVALATGLMAAGAACAAEAAGGPLPLRQFPVAQIFTFLFLMLGPFKIIGPFAQVTQGADAATVRRIALLATLFASLALAVAAFLGEYFLTSFGIPLPVLALSAGLILLLVALINILQQFLPHGAAAQSEALRTTTPLQRALSPLAFPTIVTPYGIATLVVFLALATEMEARLTVGAIVVVIMLSNLGVMLLTRHILPLLVVLLPILGAVLGVVQVALGLQIVHRSLMTLGML